MKMVLFRFWFSFFFSMFSCFAAMSILKKNKKKHLILQNWKSLLKSAKKMGLLLQANPSGSGATGFIFISTQGN